MRPVFRSQSKMKILTFLILCFASVAFADDFKAIDGKEYKNVTVSRVEPDGIVLISSSGISKVYFTELPKAVQERFHYDAAKAAGYSAFRRRFKSSKRNYDGNWPKKKTNIGPDKAKTRRLSFGRLLPSPVSVANKSK